MWHKYTPAVLGVILVVLVVAAAPVAAHDWQTTVTQGPMELGISSSPGSPVAGMQTEYAARIADSEVAEGDENRLSWGGVTNTSVEVHINGPNGIHDHVTTHVPADDAHFHFAYMFPEAGTYSITLVTELEGEEYAFQFQEDVMLLPARATGPEMANLSSDVDTVQDDVSSLQTEVSDLQTQVDTLQQQLEEHNAQLEEHQADSQATADIANAQGAGFEMTAVLLAVVGIVGFVVGRRY